MPVFCRQQPSSSVLPIRPRVDLIACSVMFYRLFCWGLEEAAPVRLEILQRRVHGLDNGARRDRGAGELVEIDRRLS